MKRNTRPTRNTTPAADGNPRGTVLTRGSAKWAKYPAVSQRIILLAIAVARMPRTAMTPSNALRAVLERSPAGNVIYGNDVTTIFQGVQEEGRPQLKPVIEKRSQKKTQALATCAAKIAALCGDC